MYSYSTLYVRIHANKGMIFSSSKYDCFVGVWFEICWHCLWVAAVCLWPKGKVRGGHFLPHHLVEEPSPGCHLYEMWFGNTFSCNASTKKSLLKSVRVWYNFFGLVCKESDTLMLPRLCQMPRSRRVGDCWKSCQIWATSIVKIPAFIQRTPTPVQEKGCPEPQIATKRIFLSWKRPKSLPSFLWRGP